MGVHWATHAAASAGSTGQINVAVLFLSIKGLVALAGVTEPKAGMSSMLFGKYAACASLIPARGRNSAKERRGGVAKNYVDDST